MARLILDARSVGLAIDTWVSMCWARHWTRDGVKTHLEEAVGEQDSKTVLIHAGLRKQSMI